MWILLGAFLISLLIYLPHSELLKSKPVLKASLNDDISSLRLTLRANNTFELEPATWMGTLDVFTGKYKIEGTNIIFLDPPYDNGFIPDTVVLYHDKIILNGDLTSPDTSFANFFQIRMNELENPPLAP